ncbi:MAG: SUMF1/EgtB/PvdO family nonheme iron enzyme [Armatimonadia bacterium]|nr:SUMF1/EgtB/PvdO family nonheme iron enzyme [Armatimonadia bacterium]
MALTPVVEWMPPATPVDNADAATEAEMQAYAEEIPGTDVTFEMVPIPGGTFTMGSPEDEPMREPSEGPQFQAEIEPFWMAKVEVTWDEYDLWGTGKDMRMREAAGTAPGPNDAIADAITQPTSPYFDKTRGMGREGFPAISMTQLAAKIYCKWLSAKTGRYYRLPTEAEWEYACRAGTDTVYSFGDDPAELDTYAWYYENSDDQYHEVGTKEPNPWGLHDMHGNVSEWVLDGYTPDGYPVDAGETLSSFLVIPTDIYPRVARGGSWVDDPDWCRSAHRRGSSEGWKMGDPQIPQSIWHFTDADFIGFRVVRPLRVPDAQEAARYDLDPAQQKALRDYPNDRGMG